MKIAICEDETEIGLQMKAMMEASGREITLYSDAESLLADWDKGNRFDAVFTDIVMEDKPAGMDLCRRLNAEGKVFLIIITNYIEYAPEGYRNGVFRYLMKPLQQDMLDEVFREIEKETRKSGKFVVDAFDGERVISGGDILYVEVQGRYLDIHLKDAQEAETVVMLMQSLKEFASVLPPGRFSRINRNQLVNLERITVVKQGSLTLENGKILSVSRRQQRELQEALARCLA
ncbi:MAG: LytTR family DNA-binding domain-containing protein [Bacteroidales bacterium]|nr:LytTR family DNA-binding domain-containing protein [Lachnoclostridium sp.]MCM1384156.1 LytTR family DNA-binding domain-containing protein [Lachnoclostridium sp.]MCM1464822.1 LytTR family DNA-binding domain-containing protein [Bacteroidales bacterium]